MASPWNVLTGTGDLYIGDFGAVTEPAASGSINTVPTSGWTDLGGTLGGVSVSLKAEFAMQEMDQFTMDLGAVPSKETVEVTMSLAEITFQNLNFAMAGGTINSAGGVNRFDPVAPNAGRSVAYKSIMIVGRAPGTEANPATRNRIIVLRKVLSTAGLTYNMSKTDQTVLEVTFSGFAVSKTVLPWNMWELTPAA